MIVIWGCLATREKSNLFVKFDTSNLLDDVLFLISCCFIMGLWIF